MNIYEELYKTATRRTVMRGLEVGLISFLIGVLTVGMNAGWFPATWIGVVAAVLKALREMRDAAVENE